MTFGWRAWALVGAALLLGGCAQFGYLAQAAHGQFSLLAGARPIDEWLASPETDAGLKDKLQKVQQIRRFAARELGLPDNATFTTYADLKRPFVMWNVVATPELSLKPLEWCFPVAGCVNYRGYYDRADALAYAHELRAANYDVDVSGVPAYSTLGWFKDPVLSTFIHYPEAELARLVFHELAHQVVYVPGDTRFNEAFAVAVEEVGVAHWIQQAGDDRMRRSWAAYESRKRDFLALLLQHRQALQAVYDSDDSDDEKRRKKKAIFASLQDGYQDLKRSWGGYSGYDRWFAEPLSNAHLALIAAYHDLVPAFHALLGQHRDLPSFYQAVRQLASLDKEERATRLAALSNIPAMAGDGASIEAAQ